MPKHDELTTVPKVEGLSDDEAAHVEGIAKILAEHLYAQPNMENEQAEMDDCSLWNETSNENKRIYLSCALEVHRFTSS